jgi:hypothetical protein
MAKKDKARVPKRIAGVKIPKRVRKALRPVAAFLDTELGRNVGAAALTWVAATFATADDTKQAFKHAAKRMRKGGGGLHDLALHLARAVALPALVAVHARLPDEVRSAQRAQAEEEDQSRRSPGAVH